MFQTHSARGRWLGRAVAMALGIGIAVTAHAAPARAAGAETFHYSFKGETAEARFSHTDPSGCIATRSFVHAVDGRVKFDGSRGPETTSTVFLYMVKYDVCNREPLMVATGWANASADELQIDRLEGASLATTVQMYNFTAGYSFPLEVDLQWRAVGERTRAREHAVLDYPGFRVNIRENATTRAADVAGVITDGLVNFAAGGLSQGSLSSVIAGDMTVVH